MYACEERFQLCHVPRRGGKSEIWKRKLVRNALRHDKWWRGKFVYAAPVRDQAKRIAWQDLKDLSSGFEVARPKESELIIPLWNADIHVVGMDVPERIEGDPLDEIVMDEYANMKAEAYKLHVRPALSTPGRLGRAAFIGVPEGRNHYYELMLQFKENGWPVWWWPAAEVLDPEEVEAARKELSELEFKQEYEGDFVTFEGLAYYTWNRDNNVVDCKHLYNPRAPLKFCFDFNIAPGVASVVQEVTIDDRIVDAAIGEVWIPKNSNTPAVCRKLLQQWRNHRGLVYAYGDATGGSGGTAKVDGTDWELIEEMLGGHFGDRFDLRVRDGNPPERVRVNAMCRRLQTADGTVHFVVDPSCKWTIKDFEGTRTLVGGSGEIDKKIDRERTHMTDAIGYMAEYDYSLHSDYSLVQQL